MIMLSISASSRYMYWRVTDTLGFTNVVDAAFGYGLLLAELYAFAVLLIGCFRPRGLCSGARFPCHRTSVPGRVDVFIPTYNEPLGACVERFPRP